MSSITAQGFDALTRALRAAPDLARDNPFTSLASFLLQRTVLLAGGVEHRIEELEFYYHAELHPDPFAHCHPAQRNTARWYFHRAGAGYRGGTYKGLDITFAPSEHFGGILIRSLRSAEGEFVSGSSSCVEHLLALTGHECVAALDSRLADRRIDDSRAPLALRPATRAPAGTSPSPIWQTARVGLTLKRAERFDTMEDYILRPYRFLQAPREVKKGRPQLILALARSGESPEAIHRLTNTPRKTIASHLEAYAEGRKARSTANLRGRTLSSRDLCWLQGALDTSASR